MKLIDCHNEKNKINRQQRSRDSKDLNDVGKDDVIVIEASELITVCEELSVGETLPVGALLDTSNHVRLRQPIAAFASRLKSTHNYTSYRNSIELIVLTAFSRYLANPSMLPRYCPTA